MNLRLANNKALHAGVLVMTALFSVFVITGIGGVFYAASGGSWGWGIFGALATILIFAYPFYASFQEDQELKDYYNSNRFPQ